MSRKNPKEWNRIGTITEQWVKASYPNADVQSTWKYKDRMNEFLEFLGMTDTAFIEGYKRAKDRLEWAKQIGFKVVAFYNDRVGKGYATNTVRAEVSTVRAFCRDNATTLILTRRKIAKAKSAKGEHEFTREELAKMFYVADVRAKAVLATETSLGFSVEDFSELKRDFIENLVNKTLSEKRDFIPFSYERGKTGVESRSHLTPEAVNSLKAWFDYIDQKRLEKGLKKSEWVWCNGNCGNLNEQTLNDIVKDLVKKANIQTTGKVKFHLLRKFVMGAVHTAGFDSWETKRLLGKEIPTSDSTYLQKLNADVDRKFPQAYDELRLTGYANNNHTKLEGLEAKVQQMEIAQEQLIMTNEALLRMIQLAIPPEAMKRAILETAKRLPNMNNEKLAQLELSLKSTRILPEMLDQLNRLKGLKQ